MRNLSKNLHLITFILIISLLMSFTQPVFAQEATGDIEITGTIISVNETDGTFEIQTETGEIYTIHAEGIIDISTIQIDAQITIEGVLNEDGSISPDETSQDPTEDVDADDTTVNYYCSQSEEQHPFGARLVEEYGTDYTTIQSWVCDDGSSWGQVMLALRTSQLTGEDADSYLAARSEGSGWGQIWQAAGLIGKESKNQNQNEEKNQNTENNGKSDRQSGPPEDKGPKKDK